MNAARKLLSDPTLPRPSRGGPVDLVYRYQTPDGVARTFNLGRFETPMVAQEAARERHGVNVWTSTGDGTWRSAGDEYAIQPVAT